MIELLDISTDLFRAGDLGPPIIKFWVSKVLAVFPAEVTEELEVVCCTVDGIKVTLMLVGVGGAVKVLSNT